MTRNLQKLVTEAVSLDREIADRQERLKLIKSQLVDAAREHSEELTATEGGGTRWVVTGNDGCIARVNFPAPSLKSKIEPESKLMEKIEQLTGHLLSRLFTTTTCFKPVENFQEDAKTLLARPAANKLIKLCLSASAPRVSFETAERPTAERPIGARPTVVG